MTRGSLRPSSSCRRYSQQLIPGAKVHTKCRIGRTSTTYSLKARAAEAGASIEPVIVAEFVDLDALLIGGLMRHGLCHHQRLGLSLDSEVRIRNQIRGKFEVLLQGQLRWFVGTQNRKRRHDSLRCAQMVRDSGTSGYPDYARCAAGAAIKKKKKKLIQ